jgi:hypothetical protein
MEVVRMSTTTLPSLRLIGKQCDCEIHDFVADWDEWFENGWFSQLLELGVALENGDAYLGVTDTDNGYWIGLLFPQKTPVPDGFNYADIPKSRFAIAQIAGANDKELLGLDGINLLIREVRKRNMTPAPLWKGWCIERYRLPLAPDGKGRVLFECLYEIL